MKLIFAEDHSEALKDWLVGRDQRISSIVSRIEVLRTARRVGAVRGDQDAESRAADALTKVGLLALAEPVAERATAVRPPTLRSLDAIHLATALLVGTIEAFVTYDDRLARAARAVGIRVVQPGRPEAEPREAATAP